MHAHVRAHHKALVDRINSTGDYDKDIEAGLRKALQEFKATGAY